jgi:hypothetical protein
LLSALFHGYRLPYGGVGMGAGRQWEASEYSGWPPAAVDVYPDIGAAEHAYTADRHCWIREGRVARRRSAKTAKSCVPRRWLDQGIECLGLPIAQFVEPVGLNSCAHYLGETLNETITTALSRGSTHSVFQSPPNTIAAALEVDLYDDMDEADETAATEEDKELGPRVDLRLKREIDLRCGLLESCLAERDASVQRQRKAVLARWELDRDAP